MEPLVQQLASEGDDAPGGDGYLEADISGYRTGRLAQDEGEPPAVQITQKNLEEVLAWERKLLDKAKAWNLTSLSQYLSQIAATLGIQTETLIVIPVDLLQPIHPYMSDFSTEQARTIKYQTIMERTAKHAANLDAEKNRQKTQRLPDYTAPQDSWDNDFDELQLSEDEDLESSIYFGSSSVPVDAGNQSQMGFGKATPYQHQHQHQQGGAPMAFPDSGVGVGVSSGRYAHPLTDLSRALANPTIRARMELFYKHSNQMSVMSIISNPQFHGDINKVVKSSNLQGWEQDALSRITSQPYTQGRFDRAEPHHFYSDNGARRAFAQLVSAVARQNGTINNSATQMASMQANSMVAEAVIKCTACVWSGGTPKHLVLDNDLYASLTSGNSHTIPHVSRTLWSNSVQQGSRRTRSIFY